MTTGEPPTLDGPSIKPGYLTTEFWQANLVHLFAALSSILVFANVNIAHLTAIQGAIPAVALVASVLAQTAYNNKRANVKLHQLSQWGEVNVAKASALKPLAPVVANIVTAADPALAAPLAKVEGAVAAAKEGWTQDQQDAQQELQFPTSVPDGTDPAATAGDPPADEPAPADSTDVVVPDNMPTEVS